MSKFDIRQRAMLMKVSVHEPTFQKQDKKLNAETARRAGAQEKRLRTTKQLIDREAMENIAQLSHKIRVVWRKRSSPWLDDGTRIFLSAVYFDAVAEIKAVIHEREAAVDRFLAEYDRHRDAAKEALNGAFSESDYPPVQRLRKAFGVDVVGFPIPAGDDFRVSFGSDDQEAEIRKQVDEQVQIAVHAAMRDPWERIYKVVGVMVERLNAFAHDAEGKVISTFRDSLVENVRSLVDILPALNLTEDPELDSMTIRLRDELCRLDGEDLRSDGAARRQVANRAEKILAEVCDFLA